MTLYKNIREGLSRKCVTLIFGFPESFSRFPMNFTIFQKIFPIFQNSRLFYFAKAQKELSIDSRKSFSSPWQCDAFLKQPHAHENWYNISSSTLMISFFLSFLNLTKKNTSLRWCENCFFEFFDSKKKKLPKDTRARVRGENKKQSLVFCLSQNW